MIDFKEICEIAIINKATFYKYYQDVFDLSDKLENECLDRCQFDPLNLYCASLDIMCLVLPAQADTNRKRKRFPFFEQLANSVQKRRFTPLVLAITG